jgi:hypothetical protein
MVGRVDQLIRGHGRRIRVAALPVVAAAAVFTVIGKGLGWRIGTIAILAGVTIWMYALYFLADQRYERMETQGTASRSSESYAQLHEQVCETTAYWDYLHDLLAEVANASIPDVLAEPTELPSTSTALGSGFAGCEKMMREFIDHVIPPKSRYVVYYIFGDKMLASSEVHNGWKGRPPDLQLEPERERLLLTMVKRGDWVVLPDVNNPAPGDRRLTSLCFDKTEFQSFASLPLRVEEPVNYLGLQYAMAVGALIIESPEVNGMSESFCHTAMQIAVDMAFASARAKFAGESADAKR